MTVAEMAEWIAFAEDAAAENPGLPYELQTTDEQLRTDRDGR